MPYVQHSSHIVLDKATIVNNEIAHIHRDNLRRWPTGPRPVFIGRIIALTLHTIYTRQSVRLICARAEW